MDGRYPRAFGDYILLERLGAGGMSEVDLARRSVEDAHYVRLVVIKRIKADRTEDESFVRMFKDEARITAQLHHQNIAQVFDFGRIGDEYYLALEYIPGLDLRQVLAALSREGRRIPLRVVLTCICEVLSALDYAHSRVDPLGRSMNIVHRDVNPRNIMLSTRGEVKLIDFGVAKAEDRLERTRTDHVKGKFAYMAPEQIDGSPLDHRADLFAVGLTLHELVMGVGPFHGLGQVQILHKLLSGRPPVLPPPPELRDGMALVRIHDKALARDPADRYASAGAMRRDLEAVAEELGGLCTPGEMARFLREVDANLEQTLLDKIASYSGALPALWAPTPAEEMDETVDHPPPVPPPPEPQSVSGTARVGLVAGGAVLGGGALVLGLLALGAIAVALWWSESREPVPVAPVAEIGGPGPAPERPVADTGAGREEAVSGREEAAAGRETAEARLGAAGGRETAGDRGEAAGGRRGAPAPAGDPPPPASLPSAPRPSDPPPSPEGREELPEVPLPAEPSPSEGASSPVGAASGEPVPDAPPAATGTVQVTAASRGRAIAIDGVDTGAVTPATLEVPVGSHRVEVDGYAPRTVTVREGLVTTALFR